MTGNRDRQVYTRGPVRADRYSPVPYLYTDLYERFLEPYSGPSTRRSYGLIVEVLWDTNEYIREMGNFIGDHALDTR